MSIAFDTLASVLPTGCVFIETGSRWGDTTMRALELGVRAAYTIEADERLFGVARDRLTEKFRNVHVYKGRSQAWLPTILSRLEGAPVVFWLDAHDGTSSPVLEELRIIREWGGACTILIDDMRVFRSGHWGVSEGDVLAALPAGSVVSFLPGVEPDDILMAVAE